MATADRLETKMKKDYFYRKLVLLGLLLWVLETALFGFNQKPINVYEQMADIVTWLLVIWGVIGDLAGNLKVIKETHITTKNVDIIEPKIKFKE